MAQALGVSVDELLGEMEKEKRAGAGPAGRTRRLFEAASKLPRSQQEKIAAALEAFVRTARPSGNENGARQKAKPENSAADGTD